MIGRDQWKRGGQRPLLLVLLLVALVPAACVLWLMTVAMRNERLAVQQKLTSAYVNHLGSVQRALSSFWRDKQNALKSTGAADSAPETFAAIIRSNLADSAVLHDPSGKVLYPISALTNLASQIDESAAWAAAREIEFRQTNYTAAAEAYERIARETSDIHLKARAIQSRASCLQKGGNKAEAIRLLAGLTTNAVFQNAVGSQGTLTVPNVQLLLLKLIEDPADELFRDVLQRLTARLNGYGDPRLSSSQRRFLMGQVQSIAPSAAFPMLPAEQLAADYLDRNPS